MKTGYTHISYLLDRSGSMGIIATDVIGGFNQFISAQKEAPGKATFTMAQFDNNFDYVYKFKDIQDIRALDMDTFNPRGSTALIDAICKLIDETGAELARLGEEDRPAGVLFVIQTDGEENSSHTYKLADVKRRISDQKLIYNWDFIYIGANVDAYEESSKMGIDSFVSYEANSKGVNEMYRSFTDSTLSYRSAH